MEALFVRLLGAKGKHQCPCARLEEPLPKPSSSWAGCRCDVSRVLLMGRAVQDARDRWQPWGDNVRALEGGNVHVIVRVAVAKRQCQQRSRKMSSLELELWTL